MQPMLYDMQPMRYSTIADLDKFEVPPDKKNISFSDIIGPLFMGCCGCLLFLIVFSIPTLSIVFSQVFPWQENDSVCDSKTHKPVLNVTSGVYVMQPVKCKCRADFPKYMLVAGVLGITALSFMVAGACCFVQARNSEDTKRQVRAVAPNGSDTTFTTEDTKRQVRAVAPNGSDTAYATASCFWCIALLCYVAGLTITIMMLESMFSSNKKCGESMWLYGIFLCVCFGISALPGLIKFLCGCR